MDHEPARPATLHDVAREAGVAVSTASRALSNPGRVSAGTRAHVLDVARRIGYRPNRLAQALPSGRTRMLALLVPDITNPHHFALIRGAEIQAAAAGYTLVLGDGQESPALEVGHADRLGSFVDGFVLISPRMDDSALRELRARHPVVLFNRTMAGVPSVVVDAVDAARQIVEHLHALGHRRLAYLGGPRTSWIDARRWQALEDQAARRGIAALRLGPFEPVLEAGAAAADAGLASGVGALVAFNDLLAIGVLQRLERRGVAVPGRISVVGADDIFGAAFCHPPLTTVASPAERAGRLLVDMLTGVADAAELVLPCPLVARESTGPAPG